MSATPAPFSRYEFLIAWRYLRAKRAEGGVSVMTWISLVGIMLAVAALIITMAVRAGFRAEFVDTILGANAHVTVYSANYITETGQTSRAIENYVELANAVGDIPGVTRAAPLIKSQVMATANQRNAGIQVFGIAKADLESIPGIAQADAAIGSLDDFERGVAIGSGVARELGVTVGDTIRLISPNGVRTAFGTSPRISDYPVTFIFTAGRFDIDKVRVYMPFSEAQIYFNREGVADEIEVMVEDPENIEDLRPALLDAGGERVLLWTWQQSAGAFLRTLVVEDRVMFILMSVLVLVASMNIISGLVMLVKNKGRDIGILRTMGLTEGSVTRVFFICGALVGVIGTVAGMILGCLFAYYFEEIFALVSGVSKEPLWSAETRGIYRLPAKLEFWDVFAAAALSLALSFGVTLIPARRAARMNPVEALRYE